MSNWLATVDDYFIGISLGLLAITTAAAKKIVATHTLPVQPARPASSAAPVPAKPVTTSTPSTVPSSVITSKFIPLYVSHFKK